MKISKYILPTILTVIAIVFIGFEYSRCGDFQIYFQAAKDIVAGKNIYNELYGDSKVFPYLGSPTLAYLLSPLSNGSCVTASILWKLINILLLYRVWKLLEHYLPLSSFSKKQYSVFIAASFLASSFLIYRNFHLVQFTIFLLFAILESIYQVRNNKKPFTGAIILGLGIISKLLPLVLIPYLVYRGYWKSVLYTIVVLTILVIIPSFSIGWEHNIDLYQQWLSIINPSNADNVFDVSTRTIHGIAALISTLTIEGIGNDYSLDFKRNVLNLQPETVQFIILIVKSILILFTLYFLNWKTIFSKKRNKLGQLWELSYILLITPLIFPQQRSYAFIFIMPALIYLFFGFIRNPGLRKPGIMFILSLSILLINLDLLFGQFREYYWHFKTLTYGVLFMIPLLSWMPPEKILNKSALAEPEN